jgi:ribosomal protein S18 acetylase RimI-like enzyme
VGLNPSDLDPIAALEAASLSAWPPRETERLNGWQLRHGGARSRRLNSVQTSRFDGDVDVASAIDAVERWYAGRGLPPCFHLTDAARPSDLDRALEARGYGVVTPTSVLLAEADAIPGTGPAEVELAARAGPDVLDAICDPAWPAAIRREREALFARIRPVHRFAISRVDGRSAASGLCVVDGHLAGLFSMRTQPAFRRRGLATRVLLGLAGWARAAGARRVFLQVEEDNAAALRLYRRFGFARVYGYHYRELGLS